ncbi:ATPase SWSAP1 [Cololabis saira]|uniref:ATPase SWSAP1 n=1 Tax=Cololabis saira TaxID=129043 RepID=UPI002AD52E0E|nr:ATPase SWSAP1 [Cololabis saira]
MTDILTLVFQSFVSETCPQTEPASSAAPACSTLVVGEQRLSRPLLLLAAVTAASQLGVRVLFFTHTQIQSLPPALQRSLPNLGLDGLKKITFHYPRTLEELLLQVSSLHESPTPPSLIIVDGLEAFLCGSAGGSHGGFHSGEQSGSAHLSALLCDTAAFLTQVLEQRGSSSGPCRIIASFLSEVDTEVEHKKSSAATPVLEVLDRYFQVRCTLDQDKDDQAAAVAVQELWHIYLSGRGITEASSASEGADSPGVAQEWELLLFPDGLMEFRLV